MAGGKGERFWPKSRYSCPKQFLSLVPSGKTMIQLTVERILPLIPAEDIYIVTNHDYVELAQTQIPNIPQQNILEEPVARNTAPCIGLAAAIISKRHKDCVMLVLPADHLISNETLFLDTLRNAASIASRDNNMITVGITPTYPETGYGYIKFVLDQKVAKNSAYRVSHFVEKPNLELAREYVQSGSYLWNSGMFVWKIKTIMTSFEKLLPTTYEGLLRIRDAFGTKEYETVLAEEYGRFSSVSIDCAIMEKSDDIFTIPGCFGWDDVGSLLSLERINKQNADGNTIKGESITIDTKNTIIWGEKRLITTIGLRDIIVVDSEDALLICRKNNTQDVKRIIEQLKNSNRVDLL